MHDNRIAVTGRVRPVRALSAATMIALVVVLAAGAVLALAPGRALAEYPWASMGGPGADPGEGVMSYYYDVTEEVLYVGTLATGIIWRYDESSGAWTDIGAPGGVSPVRSLIVIGGRLFAGMSDGAVYRNDSPLAGDTWTDTSCPATSRIFSMSYDGKNLYAASREDAEVFRNPNPLTGTTWQSAGIAGTDWLDYLANDGSCLYAASEDSAVYRNTDPGAGTTWTAMGTPDGSDVRVLCYAQGILYAGTRNGNVFRNTDPRTGSTWQAMGSFGEFVGVHGLIHDDQNNVLYAGTESGHVWKNIMQAAGANWLDLGLPSASFDGWYARPLACSLARSRLYAGSVLDDGLNRTGLSYSAGLPVVTSVSPDSAGRGETVAVTITCANADIAAKAMPVFAKPGISVKSVDIRGKNVIVAELEIAPGAVVGPSDVWVTYIDSAGKADKANLMPGGFGVTEVTDTWYLAEGTTAWGFSTIISIQNPNDGETTARVTYMDPGAAAGSGVIKERQVKLPPASQTNIFANEDLGYETDFSAKVQTVDAKPIGVDRTMSWATGYGQGFAVHNSIGVTAPAFDWFLAEGSSAWGFECWTLVQNPNDTPADVTLTYMIEGSGPSAFKKTVPARSRATFGMKDDVGEADASIQVTGNVPVIAERSMYKYWKSPESGEMVRREGHESVGTTAPEPDFYLAEGSTAWGFTTYVLVQNPNRIPANVTITYNTSEGASQDVPFALPAASRKTVRVNERFPDMDLSTHVHADVPIVAERAMYWSIPSVPGSGEAMHDSIGVNSPHRTWYVPYGAASPDDGGFETYTLVQNAGAKDVKVRISYLQQGGKDNVSFIDTVKAGSRKTYNMAERLPSASASVLVECLTAGGVIVERSMYAQGRWGGADSIGGFSD